MLTDVHKSFTDRHIGKIATNATYSVLFFLTHGVHSSFTFRQHVAEKRNKRVILAVTGDV